MFYRNSFCPFYLTAKKEDISGPGLCPSDREDEMCQAHLSSKFSKAIFNDLLMLTSDGLKEPEFWLKVIGFIVWWVSFPFRWDNSDVIRLILQNSSSLQLTVLLIIKSMRRRPTRA